MGLGLVDCEHADRLTDIRGATRHPGDLGQVAYIKELDTVSDYSRRADGVEGAGSDVESDNTGILAVDRDVLHKVARVVEGEKGVVDRHVHDLTSFLRAMWQTRRLIRTPLYAPILKVGVELGVEEDGGIDSSPYVEQDSSQWNKIPWNNVTRFLFFLSMNSDNSGQSWFRSLFTLESKIKIYIKFCVGIHFLILKRVDFKRVCSSNPTIVNTLSKPANEAADTSSTVCSNLESCG